MAINLGGISWDVTINAKGAEKSFADLIKLTDGLKTNLASTSGLFGGLGNNFDIFDKKAKTLTQDLQDLAKGLDAVEKGRGGSRGSGAKDLSKGIDSVTKSVKDLKSADPNGVFGASYRRNAKKATERTLSLRQAVLALGTGLSTLAAAAGTVRLTRFIKDATLLAARVQNLGTVVQNVGRIAGFNTQQINNFENSIKSLGITTRAARQGLAQLSQANIDLGESAKLTRIAQDAAVIAGIDSSEAFNRLVVSIQRNDVRLLRNLGIVINLNSVYRKFSQQTGRTVAQLTAFEKRQLVLNEVIERGALIAGTYEASLKDVFKQLTSLRRKVEEASVAFGKQFLPILESATQQATDFFERFEKGTAFITPKTAAVLTSVALAIGAIGAAIGTVVVVGGAAAAAFTALGAAAAPVIAVTAALAGLTALAVGGVAVWVDYKLAAAEAAVELENLEEKTRNETQAIEDAQPALDKVIATSKRWNLSTEENTDSLIELQTAAQDLVSKFPDLAKEITAAANSSDTASVAAGNLAQVFADRLPVALLKGQERIAEYRKQVQGLQVDLRKGLGDLLFFAGEAEALRQAEIKSSQILAALAEQRGGNVQDISIAEQRALRERKAEEALAALRRQSATEAKVLSDQGARALLNNLALRKRLQDQTDGEGRSLEELAKAALLAGTRLSQDISAQSQTRVKAFKTNVDLLLQESQRAAQEISKIETASVELVRGTNAQTLRETRKSQEQILAINVQRFRDIQKEAEKTAKIEIALARKSAKAQIEAQKERFADDPVKRGEKIAELEAAREEKINGIRLNSAKTQQEIGEAIESILFARIKVAETLRDRIEDREVALESLQEAEQREANQIIPEVIAIRQRQEKAIQKLTLANRDLDKQAGQLEDRFKSIGRLDLFDRFQDSTELAKESLEGLGDVAKNLVVTLVAANKFREQNNREAELLRRSSDARVAKLVREQFDRLLDEEDEFVRKRIALEEDGEMKLALLTKRGVDDRIKELERGSERTASFITRSLNSIAEGEARGLGRVNSTISNFQKAISTATSAAQLADLERLFPQVIAKNVEDATRALDKAQKKLAEFDDVGLDRKRAAARGEILAKERELTAAGIRGRVFQQEIFKLEQRQRKEQESERKALADEVEKQQKRQEALQKAAESGEDSISKAIQERTKLLDPENKQLGELVALKEESLRLSKEENDEIQRNLELLDAKKDLLLAQLPDDARNAAINESESRAAERERPDVLTKRRQEAERVKREQEQRLQAQLAKVRADNDARVKRQNEAILDTFRTKLANLESRGQGDTLQAQVLRNELERAKTPTERNEEAIAARDKAARERDRAQQAIDQADRQRQQAERDRQLSLAAGVVTPPADGNFNERISILTNRFEEATTKYEQVQEQLLNRLDDKPRTPASPQPRTDLLTSTPQPGESTEDQLARALVEARRVKEERDQERDKFLIDSMLEVFTEAVTSSTVNEDEIIRFSQNLSREAKVGQKPFRRLKGGMKR